MHRKEKIAGILCVFQDFLTKRGGKFAAKTGAVIYSVLPYVNYLEDRSALAVSRRLPLAKLEQITAEDLSKETLLVISPEDSKVGSGLLLTHAKQRGISTQNIRYAPNLSTMILWIEMGLGIGVVNGLSILAKNPAVRLIDELPLDTDPSCVAWRKDNLNPAVLLFRDYTEAQL